MHLEPEVITTKSGLTATLFPLRPGLEVLRGPDRASARATILAGHYTHSVPSGKSHYLAFDGAIIVWSIPANCNIAKFLGVRSVWELSRLWAPDGHEPNLLTRAISAAVKWIATAERPDVLVSYADPNVGHSGGVYRAASWIAAGQSEETRRYRHTGTGAVVARRKFHSGGRGLLKAEIEALGYVEERGVGKLRFLKPLSRIAKRRIAAQGKMF
jgi:hypothetical protein